MARKKKEMAIILDFDDVVCDFLGSLAWLQNKLHGTSLTKYDIKDWNFENLEVEDSRGNVVTGKQLRETFQKWEDKMYPIIPLISGSKEALIVMKSLGYKIFFMTARDEKFHDHTLLHIFSNNLPYDELFFEKEKAKKIRQLSKEYNIQVFADDKLSTVVDVSENTKVNNVYLIETAATRDLEDLDENITKVRDLFEMTRYLKEVKL